MEGNPQVYRLLVGPYRLAQWAILCRFKTRFVEQLVDNALGPRFADLSGKIVADLEEARREFVTRRKGPARVVLAEQIEQLIEAGHISREKLQKLAGVEATPDTLAELRMEQIEGYFDRLRDVWLGQAATSHPERPAVYAAISSLIWPYYAIVYRGRDAHAEKRYFATWMPPSGLVSEAMISRRGGLSAHVNALGLYPARVAEPDARGASKALMHILDATSEAMLDFENPDPLLGVIQELPVFRADQLFVRRDWMHDAILKSEPGAFTDIFHFINDGFRYFLTGDEIELGIADVAQEPLGVLFVVTASVPALLRLADPNEQHEGRLQQAARASWLDVGGRVFTRMFNRDLADLLGVHIPTMRDRYNQTVRLRAYEGFGHTLKNIIDATGWEAASRILFSIRKHGERLPKAEMEAGIESTARTLATFGMVRGLGEFVRIESAAGRKDWPKFASWIDYDALKRWRANDVAFIAEEYAASTFAVAQSVSFGMGWKTLTVDCADQGIHFSFDEKALEPLKRDRLFFPPFKRGSDVVFAFFFALAEPLTNAIRGLFEHQLDLPPGSGVNISVRTDLTADRVSVEIGNLSTATVNQTLSGLENTKSMLSSLGFIRIHPPKARALGEGGLFEIGVTVDFEPMRLVDDR